MSKGKADPIIYQGISCALL